MSGWRCNLHGVTGKGGDFSLQEHERAEHDSATICVTMTAYVEPCPECAVGKCGNCDGRSIDHVTDEIVRCPCLHEKKRATV